VIKGALIAGRWQQMSPGDHRILEKLCDCSLTQLLAELAKVLGDEDPPVERIEGSSYMTGRGTHWFVRSPADAFEAWGPTLDAHMLERISAVVRLVFAPPYEQDPNSMPSTLLRDGIAESLLLIAARGPYTRNIRDLNPRGFIASVVEELTALALH